MHAQRSHASRGIFHRLVMHHDGGRGGTGGCGAAIGANSRATIRPRRASSASIHDVEGLGNRVGGEVEVPREVELACGAMRFATVLSAVAVTLARDRK